MANENLTQLRDKCRAAEVKLAQAQEAQRNATAGLESILTEIRALGFDPEADDLTRQIDDIARDAEEVLNEVRERLAKAEEALNAAGS